jgi:hypothetical protein
MSDDRSTSPLSEEAIEHDEHNNDADADAESESESENLRRRRRRSSRRRMSSSSNNNNSSSSSSISSSRVLAIPILKTSNLDDVDLSRPCATPSNGCNKRRPFSASRCGSAKEEDDEGSIRETCCCFRGS